MALPGTIDPTTPLGSDSPSLGDDQLRALKQYLVDVAGYPNASAVTAAASTITTGGLVTFSQSPLTVPTLLQGTASQVLRIGSQYSNIGFEINAATIMAITATGLLQQTRYHEWASGVTGVLGTQGSQPLILRSNTQDWWQVNPSGILAPIPSTLDIGSVAGPNPRNLYVASNLVIGGSIQIGRALPLTLAADARGDLLYRGATASGWLNLAAGGSGQFLRTQGASGDPVWITGSAGPGAVTVSDNPVVWTGGHSWSAPTFLLTNANVLAGIGTSTPTAMLHIAGSAYVASNIFLAGYAVSNPQRSYLAGLILSTAGASTTMTTAAGQATDSTNIDTLTLTSSINKTTSAWAVGSGNGGLDTGTIAASTWYHFYLIKRIDTGVVDVLISLSATAPTMPTNYTERRRIGSGRTDGGSNWTAFTQDGDYFRWAASILDVNVTNPGTAAVSRTLTIPSGVNVQALMNVTINSTLLPSCYLSDLAANDEAASFSAAPLGTLSMNVASMAPSWHGVIRTNTSAQIRSRLSASDAGTSLAIATLGWIDVRGKVN